MENTTQEMSKTKKTINTIVIVVELIIIIFCIALSITVLVGSKSTTEELGSGTNITAVISRSMEGSVEKGKLGTYGIGSFKKGDLLIIKKIDDPRKANLKVGDVITYVGKVGGTNQLITHRITKIEELSDTGVVFYYTLGDAERVANEEDNIALSKKYTEGNIEGIVTKVIPKAGGIISWFQNSDNFLWAVVIPLAALLAYNLYVFIKMIVDYRIKKIKEQGEKAIEDAKAQNAIDEEEIKRKAIEEYLAKQAAQLEEEKTEEIGDSEDKKEV